jgi:transcription initiation factor TFIIIB Brf1 subunit/transcription initiation factor TFIIB
LTTVVNQYNDIQVKYTEVNIDKKFVHRAAIKDEILAGLIKFECIKCGIARKNKDIAMFMRLATSGFAKGENMLRELHAQGIIDIPINEDPIVGYLPRYLEALNISNERYYDFVAELVDYSESIYMGYRSQISSKIVGALWIIIRKEKLAITDKELEKAADNTKKNTFVKFYDLVMSNIDVFVDIFNKYEIPYCD